MIALEMEDGARSQGMHVPLEVEKGKETDFPSELPEGTKMLTS